MAKISTYTNNTGIFNTGDLFITANGVSNTNSVTYAKDMFSGLVVSASPNSYVLNLDDLSNDLFLRTQMGADGMFLHSNWAALNNFRSKLAGTGLINVIRGGAGFTQYLTGLYQTVWQDLLKNYGTGGTPSEFPNLWANGGTGNTFVSSSSLDSTYFREHYIISSPNGTVNYNPYTSSNKVLTDTFLVNYVSHTGAGNFNFLTGVYPGSSFAIATGINASGATLQTRNFTIKNSAPGYYQCQISGSGNTTLLRIPSITAYNSTTNSGRVITYIYGRDSGPDYTAVTEAPGSVISNIRDTVWSGINPDLILWNMSSATDMSSANIMSGMNSFLATIKLKWPNCGVVVCSAHPNNGNNLVRDNAIQKNIALKNGAAYFDGYTPFISPAVFSGRGWIGPDGAHPSSEGNLAYSRLLSSWLKF